MEVDFSSIPSLASALKGCELVIHGLGIINAPQAELEKVNISFTQNMVLAAVEMKVQKFIHISSVAATMKHGAYGLSKAAGEEAVVHGGIPYLIFRPAWIFGPNDNNNSARITRVLKYSPLVPLLGGGNFKLQPVYVDDTVNLIYQGIHFSRMNSSYTIAGSEQISLKNILETFCKYLKIKRIFVPIPLRPLQAVVKCYLAFNPNTRLPAKQILELDKHEAFDISETRRDFQFEPLKFEEGARRMFTCAE